MRPFRILWPAVALAAALLSLASERAQAWDAVWRSGPTQYTPACDPFLGTCQNNGTGFFVSQQWNPDSTPILPRAYVDGVGEIFYVSVYMQGIVSIPRYMAVHIIPPAGAQVVVNPQAPVRCFYTTRDGRNQYEFTSRSITDNTVSGTLVISGCPQPAASGPNAPFPLVTLSSGAGTAYKIPRVKACSTCPAPPSDNWPMQNGAAYEFLIPMIATRPMNGFSDDNLFFAPTAVLQADLGVQWTYPRIALYASGATAPVPEAADLRSTIALGAAPAAGMTRVEGRCTNAGPGAARDVVCTFNQLPVGATTDCGPGAPATLAAGQSIACAAEFPSPAAHITVSLDVSGFANDANPGNDRAELGIDPPPAPPGVANLVAALSLGQGAPGQTRVVGRCMNRGPDAAVGVACDFVGLPETAVVSCSPASPVASLANGDAVECVADFPAPGHAVEVSLVATSPMADPSPSDRTQSIVVQPGGQVVQVFGDGFE